MSKVRRWTHSQRGCIVENTATPKLNKIPNLYALKNILNVKKKGKH